MGLRVGLNLVKRLFTNGTKKTYTAIPAVQKRMTQVMTDPATGIIKMERGINVAGKEALATVETLPDGTIKTSITEDGVTNIWRTKKITRGNNSNVFGGNNVKIDKEHTIYWCSKTTTKLSKDYNPSGILEHKELEYLKNIGNEKFIKHNAIQDRVYNEFKLNSSAENMLKNPLEHRHIKHSLDQQDNYHYFADGSSTKYTRTIEAKKQAAIDAAKKTEEEARIAKEAAEKAKLELKASRPRMNIAKVIGKNIEDLKVNEKKFADGTIERSFTEPETGKILVKTQDKGILHKEWIYGGKADMIYMKQVGNDKPYIMAKNGNYTQLQYEKDGIIKNRKELVNKQYYNDGESYLERQIYGDNLVSARGSVTVYDKTAAQKRQEYKEIADSFPDYPKVHIWQGEPARNPYIDGLSYAQKQASKYLKELNADAQKKVLNFEDLLSEYKA